MLVKKSKMNRRDFIATSLTAGAAATLVGKNVFGKEASPQWLKRPATVIRISNSEVMKKDGTVNAELVQKMVDKALCVFADVKDVSEAWSKFVRPEDIAGLKINTLGLKSIRNTNHVSHFHAVNNALISGLTRLGLKSENIIIWDRNDRDLSNAGYMPVTSGKGVRCYGTKEHAGFDEREYSVGKVKTRFSNILTRQTTALINVAQAKSHRLAGITAAMKNHYGSINNPKEFHDNACCNPGIAEIYSLAPVQQKTRLIIVDALYAVIEGGPGWSLHYMRPMNSILVATDPVAVDRVVLEMIDGIRKAEGMEPLANRVKFLEAASELKLGKADLAGIDLVDIN